MTSPLTNDPAVSSDRVLEVFGETVIVRRDPAGQVLDAAVVEEIVPPGVPWKPAIWRVPANITVNG